MFTPHRTTLMTSALRHLAWALPALALLAGCNGGENAKPEPHAIATYAPATWQDLPAVSDDDLLAGFNAWRNGLRNSSGSGVGPTCEAAGTATASAEQVR
jgi:membrane-bound lytic murein transglycosylase A